jgi:hypothetical protein
MLRWWGWFKKHNAHIETDKWYCCVIIDSSAWPIKVSRLAGPYESKKDMVKHYFYRGYLSDNEVEKFLSIQLNKDHKLRIWNESTTHFLKDDVYVEADGDESNLIVAAI